MKKLCMILPLALILCFMVGCQYKEAMAELEEFRAQVEVEEQNIEFVKKFLVELNKQNLDYLHDAFTADFKLHFSGSSEPLNKETSLQMIPVFYSAFPDYAHKIEDMLAKGDKVVARMICKGNHKGEFMGIPPTGNTIEYGQIQIWKIKDGKTAEAWDQEDGLTMNQQLGMELKPKEGEK